MVYGRYNYSIHGLYKPTYNWGAPSCRIVSFFPKTYVVLVKNRYPNNWMVNTKLDFSICGPTSVFHFDPHPNLAALLRGIGVQYPTIL